jgi:hypothetical protein
VKACERECLRERARLAAGKLASGAESADSEAGRAEGRVKREAEAGLAAQRAKGLLTERQSSVPEAG